MNTPFIRKMQRASVNNTTRDVINNPHKVVRSSNPRDYFPFKAPRLAQELPHFVPVMQFPSLQIISTLPTSSTPSSTPSTTTVSFAKPKPTLSKSTLPTSDQAKMKRIVVLKSRATIWNDARKEWDFIQMYSEECLGEKSCICGHAIVDCYILRNTKTGSKIIVDNVCIHHFGVLNNIDITSNTSFQNITSRNNIAHLINIQATDLPKAMKSLRNLGLDDTQVNEITVNSFLLELALKNKVLNRSDVEWYKRITTGRGARIHFDYTNSAFSDKKYRMRRRMNKQIALGFSAKCPTCCSGERTMVPRFSVRKSKWYYTCPLSDFKKNKKGCGSFKWKKAEFGSLL